MKRTLRSSVAIFVTLALTLLAGCASQKYIPKQDEVLYGTWIGDSPGAEQPAWCVEFSGGLKNYRFADDTKTWMEATQGIFSSWTDSDGNVWYETFGTFTSGPHEGAKYQDLLMISKSGSEMTEAFNWVIAFDEKNYPAKMSRFSNAFYFTWHR